MSDLAGPVLVDDPVRPVDCTVPTIRHESLAATRVRAVLPTAKLVRPELVFHLSLLSPRHDGDEVREHHPQRQHKTRSQEPGGGNLQTLLHREPSCAIRRGIETTTYCTQHAKRKERDDATTPSHG